MLVGWDYDDVRGAQGYYLTVSTDPRVTGRALTKGTVVIFVPESGAPFFLQKQSELSGDPTQWAAFTPGGGGGGATFGAPANTQPSAGGAILPAKNLILASAGAAITVFTLPAPADATNAIIVKKVDLTANVARVSTPTGKIFSNNAALSTLDLTNPGKAVMFISDLTNWYAT